MRSTILEYEISKVVEMAKEGKRLDGRKADEMRKLTIETGFAGNAEGSARVRLGETEVVAGLKMLTGVPYPDSPNEGSISIGAELLPLANPDYESGPPSMVEVEIGRVVDRGIRESKAIDFSKLCIREGELSWIGFIDFYAINSDGNIFDAGAIAALLCFMQGKIPKLDEKDKIIKGEFTGKLELKRLPILTTFVKVGGTILLDPTYIEEKAAEARFSVSTTEDGFMAAMQKGIGGSFKAGEIDEMIEKAFEVGKGVRAKISKL
ncbi:MAG: RNA-binding protein [Candidatus Diapherotrites archaeon]|nr:RNA-binding protein [Candidatus Diapherotrites archaeon]